MGGMPGGRRELPLLWLWLQTSVQVHTGCNPSWASRQGPRALGSPQRPGYPPVPPATPSTVGMYVRARVRMHVCYVRYVW